MERNGQPRRKKTVKTSPSPKRKKTKSQSNKVEVYKHFNPVNKLKGPVIEEEFPDFTVPDDDCGQSKSLFKKSERRPRAKRRPSNSAVSSDVNLIKLPICESPKKHTCKSCDRAKIVPVGSKSFVDEQTSVTKCSKQKLKSSTSSVTSMGSQSTRANCSSLNQVENRIKVNLDNIRKRGNVRLSINDMRCKLLQTVPCQRPTPQIEAIKIPDLSTQSLNKQPCARRNADGKATYVQQLKDEIHRSQPKCHQELKNSVSELRSEIAKYRETLHKNVNFLQGKLGPHFLDAKLSCGLLNCPKMKDAPSQTEPMKQEVVQKDANLTEDVGCTCSILGSETANFNDDEPVCAIEYIEDEAPR